MPAVRNLMDRRVRTSGDNPATKEQSAWQSGDWRTTSGRTVNDAAALSLTAFYRGVWLIASTVGGLPIQVFEETFDESGAYKETVKIRTPDSAYLWQRPNPEMTQQSMWERVVGDEVRGNGFVFVEKDADGMPMHPWYVDRNRFKVGRTRDRLKVYEMDGEVPFIDYRQGGEIIHIPNWGGALVGYDPIKVAPQALALGLSAEEYAARSYNDGQVPPGIITSDMEMDEKQAQAVADRWERQHSGVRKSQKVAVLGNGAKFQKVSNDLESMQVIESRKFTVSDIARLLGLPPFLLGDMDHASQGGGNGLEEQNRQLMTFTLNAHINRLQQAISDDLLMRASTNRYMRMNTDALLRGNTLQRYQAYRLADWMTDNEKRRKEEMPDIDGGDVLLKQVNMAPIDDLGKAAMGAGA